MKQISVHVMCLNEEGVLGKVVVVFKSIKSFGVHLLFPPPGGGAELLISASFSTVAPPPLKFASVPSYSERGWWKHQSPSLPLQLLRYLFSLAAPRRSEEYKEYIYGREKTMPAT